MITPAEVVVDIDIINYWTIYIIYLSWTQKNDAQEKQIIMHLAQANCLYLVTVIRELYKPPWLAKHHTCSQWAHNIVRIEKYTKGNLYL